MSIEALVKIAPPPVEPPTAFAGPWEPIEAELGVTLPQDYKDFARLYGEGSFFETVGIHMPAAQSRHIRLVHEARVICDDLRTLDDLPYALWPEPGGLLPFGKTNYGDYLCWLTRGLPANWGVVVWGRGFLTFEAFDCDLTDFLAGLATGEILPEEFPDGLLPCDQPFAPYAP